MKSTRLCAVAFLAVAIVLAGCDEPTGRACTEIGCGDGLSITLQYTPGAALQVVATTVAGDARSGNCVVSSTGSCVVSFFGFEPEELTIAVFGAEQPVSVTLSPAYEEFQPNGPGCPPICRWATVEFNLERSDQHS